MSYSRKHCDLAPYHITPGGPHIPGGPARDPRERLLNLDGDFSRPTLIPVPMATAPIPNAAARSTAQGADMWLLIAVPCQLTFLSGVTFEVELAGSPELGSLRRLLCVLQKRCGPRKRRIDEDSNGVGVFGANSRNSPIRFAPSSWVSWVTPVRLPPGWLKLATYPSSTGSLPVMNRIGMVLVAARAARSDGSPPVVASTATGRRTNSAASAGSRS